MKKFSVNIIMEDLVVVIILNWNGSEVTIDCINSLLKIKYENFKIILVDNGSKVDPSVEFSCFSDCERVELIKLERNLGFTGGNNEGIRYVASTYKPKFYLLLNNDTVVDDYFLTEMVRLFKVNADCLAVVPKIFYHNNKEILWFAGGSISRLTGIARHFGLNSKDSKKYNISKKTGFMNGCCALISHETIMRIGLLDDIFFANSEDVDYSLRIIDSGYSIYYAANATIYHKVSYSFKANKGKWLAFYLAARGIVLLQKKHLSRNTLPLFYVTFSIRWVLYLTFKLFFLGDFKSIRGICQGFKDGVLNRLRFVVNND
jgi:GT2 family glycosyltransferase